MNVPSPLSLVSMRGTKSIVKRFADENGLVYFGSVSQHDDEHHILRGLTVSINHSDAHYCIGTYEGYDMAFVERSDSLLEGAKRSHHKWYIMEFDLRTNVELPHFFIGLHEHSESFYNQLFIKYPRMRHLRLDHLGHFSPMFNAKYRAYGEPEDAIMIEQLLAPEAKELISKHFGSLGVEIHEQSLYVYADTKALNEQLLNAMIKNGVWLARHLDIVSKSI